MTGMKWKDGKMAIHKISCVARWQTLHNLPRRCSRTWIQSIEKPVLAQAASTTRNDRAEVIEPSSRESSRSVVVSVMVEGGGPRAGTALRTQLQSVQLAR